MKEIHSIRSRMLLAVACVASLSAATGRASAQDADWREEQAYTLGVQAFIYGFPWIYFAQLRWQWVTQPPPDPNAWPYAPLNEFCHAQELATAESQLGGSPNVDTLYSTAWICLTNEPVILSVPAIPDRYYTFEMASMDSDNFAYVGTRATGTNAGNYAIIGPDWVGSLPPGVTELPRSHTPYAFILGRTLVYGTDDVVNIHALQDQYKLTPLSYWGTSNTPPVNRDVWEPYPTNDVLSAWKTMNRAMTENPPNVPGQQSMVNNFATIGVGPNQDVTNMDLATQAGLVRAEKEAMAIMHGFNESGGGGTVVNGWSYPPSTLGRAGQYDDFLTRAAAQCWAGIVANDPEEAIYLNTTTDDEGAQLTGDNDYTIRFPSNGMPDVGAFWSVTMYDTNHNLVANSLNCYKLGTYPKGAMQTNLDGSLTIYVQHESPGVATESNWLPAPTGEFYLILRTYLPGPDILSHAWKPPPVEKTASHPPTRVIRLVGDLAFGSVPVGSTSNRTLTIHNDGNDTGCFGSGR